MAKLKEITVHRAWKQGRKYIILTRSGKKVLIPYKKREKSLLSLLEI